MGKLIDKSIIKLRKPITVDGKELTEVKPDFGSLTGADLENVIAEMMVDGKVCVTNETDSRYGARVAARACGLSAADIERLDARDYTKLALEARNFLME